MCITQLQSFFSTQPKELHMFDVFEEVKAYLHSAASNK